MKNLKLSALALSMGLMSFSVVPVLKSAVSISITNAPISWEAESLDLGNIPQSTPKTMEFVFKNDSTAVVKITKVQGSCGCTATDYTKTDIEPPYFCQRLEQPTLKAPLHPRNELRRLPPDV